MKDLINIAISGFGTKTTIQKHLLPCRSNFYKCNRWDVFLFIYFWLNVGALNILNINLSTYRITDTLVLSYYLDHTEYFQTCWEMYIIQINFYITV